MDEFNRTSVKLWGEFEKVQVKIFVQPEFHLRSGVQVSPEETVEAWIRKGTYCTRFLVQIVTGESFLPLDVKRSACTR